MHERLEAFAANPKRALYTLSLPIVTGMLVQTLYNIIDTAYVGRLGAESIAALTFSFPLFFILIAFNAGIGSGMGSLMSRLTGQKRYQDAENTAMHGLLISILGSFAAIIIGLPFLKDLFRLFGATENVMQLGFSYMEVILIGTLFMFPTFTINSIFSSQGDTKTPVRIQIMALMLNILLDPIFIYGFDWGVQGAAVATAISFIFALFLSVYYLYKRSFLKVRPAVFKYSLPFLREIFSVGAPSAFTTLLISFYVIFLNNLMAYFSVEHVAAFGLASRLESVAILPVVGISMAMMTLVGMFQGAGRTDLVRKISKYSIKVGVLISSGFGLIFFLVPSLFLRIFTSDAFIIAIGSVYIRIDVFTFPLMAVSILISRILQGMGYGLPGLVINVVRIFVVAVPLAYFFVYLLGLPYISVAFAMILGGLASNIIGFLYLRKLTP